MSGQPAPLQRCSSCNGLWDVHTPLDIVVCSADELVNPSVTMQPSSYEITWCDLRDRSWLGRIESKTVTQRTAVRLPSLLTRLRALAENAAAGDHGGSGYGIPGSRPPGGFDAIATLLRIGRESFEITERRIPEAGVAVIRSWCAAEPKLAAAGHAVTLRRWRNWCASATGLDHVFKPNATCPHCGSLGTLRVHTDRSAMCTADGCEASWGEDDIRSLVAHIRAEEIVPRLTSTPERRAALLAASISPCCVRRLEVSTSYPHCDQCPRCHAQYPTKAIREVAA